MHAFLIFLIILDYLLGCLILKNPFFFSFFRQWNLVWVFLSLRGLSIKLYLADIKVVLIEKKSLPRCKLIGFPERDK